MGLADVVVRDTAGRWQHSNATGFGEQADTVTGMASQGIYVYAVAIHPQGFQVWRRQPTMIERLNERLPAIVTQRLPRELIDLTIFFECQIRPCPFLPIDPFDVIDPIINPPPEK
jgi:hypothetical protein